MSDSLYLRLGASTGSIQELKLAYSSGWASGPKGGDVDEPVRRQRRGASYRTASGGTEGWDVSQGAGTVTNKVRDGISNTRMTSGAAHGMDVKVKEMSSLDLTLPFQQIKARAIFGEHTGNYGKLFPTHTDDGLRSFHHLCSNSKSCSCTNNTVQGGVGLRK